MNKIFLKKRFIFLLLSLVLIQNTSCAYIGPGLGGGVIAATIGIIVAIFAALFGLIWFPLKRLLKNRKEKKEQQKIKTDWSLIFYLIL